MTSRYITKDTIESLSKFVQQGDDSDLKFIIRNKDFLIEWFHYYTIGYNVELPLKLWLDLYVHQQLSKNVFEFNIRPVIPQLIPSIDVKVQPVHVVDGSIPNYKNFISDEIAYRLATDMRFFVEYVFSTEKIISKNILCLNSLHLNVNYSIKELIIFCLWNVLFTPNTRIVINANSHSLRLNKWKNVFNVYLDLIQKAFTKFKLFDSIKLTTTFHQISNLTNYSCIDFVTFSSDGLKGRTSNCIILDVTGITIDTFEKVMSRSISTQFSKIFVIDDVNEEI